MVSPATFSLIKHNLALTLVICDYWLWRERRIEKIRHIDLHTYVQNTSYQLAIPAHLVLSSIHSVLQHHRNRLRKQDIERLSKLKENDLIGQDLPAIIPLDRFQKTTLAGFSIRNSHNHALPFLTRAEGCLIGADVLSIYIDREKEVFPATGDDLTDLTLNSEAVLQNIIYSTPEHVYHEIKALKLAEFVTGNRLDREAKKYQQFLDRRLAELGLPSMVHTELIKDCLREASGVIRDLRRTKEMKGGQGMCNIAVNPILVVGDFLASHNIRDPEYASKEIEIYLKQVYTFLILMKRLRQKAGPQILVRILAKLNAAAYTYIGFFRETVRVGEPFIVKTEQVLESLARKGFTVGYGLNLGFEKTWHTEVVCPSPLEVYISPLKNRVTIHGVKTKQMPREFFGSEVGNGRERVHYYKTMRWEDIERRLTRLHKYQATPGLRPDVTLWVRYRVASPLLAAYFFSFLMVFGGAIYLAHNHPLLPGVDAVQTEMNYKPLLAAVVSVIVFVLGFREKDTITAQMMRSWKVVMVMLAAFVFLYYLWAPWLFEYFVE